MCQQLIQSLFGGGSTPKPAAVAVQNTATPSGSVKTGSADSATPAASSGTAQIGSAIGQSDGQRKRTTELGL